LIHLNPSLQNTFGVVWSGDEALKRPLFFGDPTEEQKRELAEWEKRLDIARERGVYDGDVVHAGMSPTIFRMAPLGRTARDAVLDAVRSGKVGFNTSLTLAFRLSIRGIDGIGLGAESFKLAVEKEPITGLLAMTREQVDQVDAAAPGVVAELGLYVLDRTAVPPGK